MPVKCLIGLCAHADDAVGSAGNVVTGTVEVAGTVDAVAMVVEGAGSDVVASGSEVVELVGGAVVDTAIDVVVPDVVGSDFTALG